MEKDDDDLCVPLVASTIQMSTFGWPVWPKALCVLLVVVDCSTWVSQRLAKISFELRYVLEGSLALTFVNHVLVHTELNWQAYEIPEDQWDNVLAQLILLHIPLRCRVKALYVDDDKFKEEVSVDVCDDAFG